MLYARYSSDRQNPKSCEDQLAEARAYAQQQSWAITGEFQDDGVSGTLGRGARPGWGAVLDLVESGSFADGIILTWDLDRFSRDWGDWLLALGQLYKAGVHLADTKDGLLDQGAMMGKVSLFMKSMGASDFIDKLRRNVVRGRAKKREAGYWTSPPPFGYRTWADGNAGRILVPDPVEAPTLRRIFVMLSRGMTPAAVARQLTKERIYTRARKRADGSVQPGLFGPSTIREIGRSKTYLGYIPVYPKGPGGKRLGRSQVSPDKVQYVEGRHEGLVSPDQFEAVQEHLRSTPRGPNSKRLYPLSGLVVCGKCRGVANVTGGVWPYRNYRCKPYDVPHPCGSKRIVRVEYLEDAVKEWCLSASKSPKCIRAVARRLAQMDLDRARRRASERAPIEAEIRELVARQDRVSEAIAAGGGALSALVEKLRQIEDKLEDARASLERAGASIKPVAIDEIEALIRKLLDAGAVDLMQVRSTLEKIVLPPEHYSPPILHAFGQEFPLVVQKSPRARIPK
ncbi:MAG: recombinase family protein [bacterium]|nr:recombinase family protein [bacterium]